MRRNADRSHSLLRWTFHQGHRSLTCSLTANERDGYDVCVMPHWNFALSTIEPYDHAADAFGRHAQIAMALRGNGWTLVDHGATRPRNAASR